MSVGSGATQALYGWRNKIVWSRSGPVLTFQSVMDFTVSTRAIITSLYAHLPANGSELVLFDINRAGAAPVIDQARDARLNHVEEGCLK